VTAPVSVKLTVVLAVLVSCTRSYKANAISFYTVSISCQFAD